MHVRIDGRQQDRYQDTNAFRWTSSRDPKQHKKLNKLGLRYEYEEEGPLHQVSIIGRLPKYKAPKTKNTYSVAAIDPYNV